MGYQQLLLIVLVLIVVAIAIMIGLELFMDSASQANRDAILLDLYYLANVAQKHYRTPLFMGGGGNSFRNFTMPTTYTRNENGTYQHIKQSHAKNHIHFEGVGRERGRDGSNPIRVEVRVEIDTVMIYDYN